MAAIAAAEHVDRGGYWSAGVYDAYNMQGAQAPTYCLS